MATRTVNPDYDSVNNAISGVVSGSVSTYNTPLVDGDTCILNAGAATWPSTLAFSANIKLQGAGADLTLATPSPSTATIISGGALGRIITFTTNDTDHGGGDYKLAELTGIVWNMTVAQTDTKGAVRFQGNSHMHLVSGAVKGGIRVHHCRWRAQGTEATQTSGLLTIGNHYKITNYVAGDDFTNLGAPSNANGSYFIATTANGGVPANYTHGSTLTNVTASDTLAQDSFPFGTGGHMNGSFDHNYLDCNCTSGGGANWTISRPANADLVSTPNGYGQDDWGHPYTMGGGLAVNGIRDALYFEDNIFHKPGGGIDAIDGGGTIIFRYNTSWGVCGDHSCETGNNIGGRAVECYNNHFLGSDAIGRPGVTSAYINMQYRGGCWVSFNNRATMTKPNYHAVQMYRITGSTASGMIGLGDGTNAVDLNFRDDPLVINGQSIAAVSTPVDPRPGCIYLQGTITSTSGSSGLTVNVSVSAIGADYPSGTFVGFVIRDIVNGTDGSDLSQGTGYTSARNLSYAQISSDTRVDATHRTFILPAPSNGTLSTGIGAGHAFEVRRVQTPFCVPGSGQFGNGWTGNGGDNKNGVPFKFQSGGVDVAGNNPRWCSQEAFGVWQWDNKARTSLAGAFNPMPDLVGISAQYVPGGAHNWDGTGASSGNIPSGYPISSNPLRVGADWEAPGFSEVLAAGATGHPVAAYGVGYPNPLSQAPATKVIGLTIDNFGDFGNVITGNSATLTLHITNTGSATLTVTSISYPSGYSGAFSGTIAPNGGSQDVVVTFSPSLVQTYSGNITVNSDSTSGTNTIAITGNGVSAAVNLPTAPRGLTIVRE